MKTKRKMIIAISALAMVILAGVVAVVAVLAAQNVTVKSNLTIKYSVSDIAADVAVKYAVVKTDATSVSFGNAKTVNFDLDGFSSTGTEGFTEITTGLPTGGAGAEASYGEVSIGKDECIILEFTFNNNTVSKGFTATLKDLTTSSDVDIAYGTACSKPSDVDGTSKSNVTVAAGENASGKYYVKISIKEASKTKDVTYTTAFEWTLA